MSQKEVEAENDRYWPEWRKADISYFVMGLLGEAGELANNTKKYMRYLLDWKGKYLTEAEFKQKLKEELPDIQIYLDLIAGLYGLDIEELVRAKQKVNRVRFGWK